MLAHNLNKLSQEIAETAQKFHRNLGSIHLLAASKKQSVDTIRTAYQLGLTDFGENYVNEAVSKMELLQDCPINWHFIGHLQSNKAKLVAEHFSYVHSIDSIKLAEKLSLHRPSDQLPLKVFLQINIDHETNKFGFNEAELQQAANIINRLPGLEFKGLMALPAPRADFGEQRRIFNHVKNIQLQTLNSLEYSMGTSNDWKAALAEGSNWVRIGTTLFGPRN